MQKTYNPDNLSKSQLWMLALCCILTEGNHERHDILYFGKDVEDMTLCLRRDYGIKNRDDLIICLKELEDGSDFYTDFLDRSNFLSTLSENSQSIYLSKLNKDSKKYKYYCIVKNYDYSIGCGKLRSWDYGRYVFLCRAGAFLNYISEEEAWDFMKEVAKKAQKAYSSWKEYGLAYVAGKQYWQELITEDYANKQIKLIKNLIVKEDSPWNMLDWNTPLD